MESIIIDGRQYGLGLDLPKDDDIRLMSSVQEYPENLFLDSNDIKKLLDGDKYRLHRKEASPYVINQGGIGKCNASAGEAAMEKVRRQQGMRDVVLCDNFLYASINGGYDRGSTLIAAFKFLQTNGICPRILKTERGYYTIPTNVYSFRQLPSHVVSAAKKAASNFKGWEFYKVPKNFEGFKRCVASALARRQPVVMAWHVFGGSSRLRNGYVQCGRGPGNHASMFHSAKFVGGSDIVHPDLENSWGPSKTPLRGSLVGGWGEDGFGLMTMEDAYRCIEHHDYYVVTSAKPSEVELSNDEQRTD